MRAYRFRLYPSKAQEKEMLHHLWLEKNLWNALLEQTKKRYDEEKRFHSKSELQLMVKDSGLHSQAAQAIAGVCLQRQVEKRFTLGAWRIPGISLHVRRGLCG